MRRDMTPHKHQRRAVEAVCNALSTSDRARVTMACGTGKTEAARWTAAALRAARVVVFVPSLNLVDQTWRRWSGMGPMPPAMAVCSDEKIGRETFIVADYGWALTSTDPAEIAAFLAGDEPRVVFCTYQSADRLAEAMDVPGVAPFDLAICDEAHWLAGGGKVGAAVLADDRIRTKKRTFWTATPKMVCGEDVVSMDNAEMFGEQVFAYSFGEAIKDGELSQFRIVAVQVSDPRVGCAIASDKGVEDAAVVAAVANTMQELGMRRVISFHSLVRRAAAFTAALPQVTAALPAPFDVYAAHVHGEMPMPARRAEIDRLRGGDGFVLLANARCLGEGVDVPELDGVVFADPRTSQIEIWQAIGRAIRKSHDGKVATVLIPVFVPNGMDPEAAIAAGKFRPVFDILRAMQAHDPSMSDVIARWSERRRSGGISGGCDEPLRFEFIATADMIAALSVVVVDQTVLKSSRWHIQFAAVSSAWPNLTVDQMRWCTSQRTAKRGNPSQKMTTERERLLESLPGWKWEYDPPHRQMFELLRSVWPNTTGKFSTFCTSARISYANGRMDPARVAQFESLPGWSWTNVADAKWMARFQEIASRWPSVTASDELVLKAARQAYAETSTTQRMTDARKRALESLPGWEWCPRDASWRRRFEKVKAGWRDGIPHPSDYSWISMHRAAMRGMNKIKLTCMKIQLLESLPCWEWEPARGRPRYTCADRQNEGIDR